MKTKLNRISKVSKALLILAFSGSITANAQEKESKFSFGMNADGYFKFDGSQSNGKQKTRFTESHNSYEIGSASFNAQHKTNKTTVFVDLGAGKRIDQLTSNTNGTEVFIKQAFVSYEIIKDVKLTGGSWKKHIGYEHVNAIDNGNYSMSYAFSNGPFFNTGIKVDYQLDKLNFMVGVGNATDFRSAVNAGSTQKNVFGQVGYTEKNTKIIYGLQTRGTYDYFRNLTQNDLIVEHKFNTKFTAALNATNAIAYQNTSKAWFSVATYLKYAFSENFLINYRGEYFDSSNRIEPYDNYAKYSGSEIISNTLSVNYKVGGFTIIPEIRFDYANEKIYRLNNENVKYNAYALIGTTYQF